MYEEIHDIMETYKSGTLYSNQNNLITSGI